MRTIVVSAVNLRKGGTLTVLRGCLEYLSGLAAEGDFRIVAIVHRKDLAEYPGIEYIEMPDVIKSWGRRLWCEYVTMHRLSKQLAPVFLWLSLHDTTPRVIAERQAVYCQTSFPFYKWKLRDWRFDYKIVLFALLTRFAYLVNIRRNQYLIVQQDWLREGFSKMFRIERNRFIVAPPERKSEMNGGVSCVGYPLYTFLYVSTPDCHKNFETLCKAAELLEEEVGKDTFRVIMTVKGEENKYAKWLYQSWKGVKSLNFAGTIKHEAVFAYYRAADCLVFPSRVETWGLPISEYMSVSTEKPMLLADLPYAHETAVGSKNTAFFDAASPHDLKDAMGFLLKGELSVLKEVYRKELERPVAYSWEELFEILLRTL